MIAFRKPQPKSLSSAHQRQFLAMLPVIAATARRAFDDRDPESREEAVAEVIAVSLRMFASLVHRNRNNVAYATPLANYAIKQVKSGRLAATALNVRDVSSQHCRIRKGVKVARLDRYHRPDECWLEAVVEDRRTSPADQAAFRIDFPEWLGQLSARNRKIAEALAFGASTGEVARQFAVSKGRISQIRRELEKSWWAFHGEAA